MEYLIENLSEYKWYYFFEVLVVGITIWFICRLKDYNQVLYNIQERYPSKIQQTFEIAAEPNYFNFLLGGGFFILLLVLFTFFILKMKIEINGVIFLFVNFILLLVLLVTFWNPILTTFAMLLIGGTVFVMAGS